MYLCYVDESGTPDLPGNTSHFVLAGVSIPVWHWNSCDSIIEDVKRKYELGGSELHVGWLLRPYREQTQIANFDSLDYRQRRSQVQSLRKAELLRLQRAKNPKRYHQTRKNFEQTASYIHLTLSERHDLARQVAQTVGNWGFARLFAECVDKVHFDPSRAPESITEQAFDQLVSRFEQFLQFVGKSNPSQSSGLIIHDNNMTVAKKHTQLMRRFFDSGTRWTQVRNIIETPLFVDSQLTSMVQIADLCAYALRRYLENQEEELFDLVFPRAHRAGGTVVGVRHFTNLSCSCKICAAHRRPSTPFESLEVLG
jgi:Protein of unknown function (DUF3800)